MNAMTQVRLDSSGSSDLAVLFGALQALPGGLAVTDAGIVLYANPAWAAIFGYPDALRLRGRAVEDFVPERIFRGPAKERNDPDGAASTEEFTYMQPHGGPLTLQIACSRFRIRGKEFQVVSTQPARSEHREAKQPEAKKSGTKQSGTKQSETGSSGGQSFEAVGRLTGGVAHDFNNLLTGIILYCDLLTTLLEKDCRASHHVSEIRKAGEHGATLVQQLLSVARPQAAGDRPAGVQPCSMNEVVAGLEDLLIRLIGENIAVRSSLDPNLGMVAMDPAQVQQILLNLVLNARDAMPDGGQVTVTTRNCADDLHQVRERQITEMEAGVDGSPRLVPCVELAVSDSGCGMNAETLNRAFEPFFTTKMAGRGNGLGLANARRLAGLEGGVVRAESQPGNGTRVSLLLPRLAQDVSASLKANLAAFNKRKSNTISPGTRDPNENKR
jgi:signal transduction histidine kinase